eukprot:969488-Rhodomonas_salina.1
MYRAVSVCIVAATLFRAEIVADVMRKKAAVLRTKRKSAGRDSLAEGASKTRMRRAASLSELSKIAKRSCAVRHSNLPKPGLRADWMGTGAGQAGRCWGRTNGEVMLRIALLLSPLSLFPVSSVALSTCSCPG